MRCAHRGFSLIEIMIVITIISLLTAIIAPNLVSARQSAAESAAVSTVRSLIAAQVQFHQCAKVDTDSDGAGEYGGFVELSGMAAGRQASVLVPPVLSGAFKVLNAAGEVMRNNYLYKIYLPDAAGAGVGEPPAGFANNGSVDSDASELAWCCYAWPASRSGTDLPTFFANQAGYIVRTRDKSYAGSGRGPAFDAAFVNGGSITGTIALNVAGSDGNVWRHAD